MTVYLLLGAARGRSRSRAWHSAENGSYYRQRDGAESSCSGNDLCAVLGWKICDTRNPVRQEVFETGTGDAKVKVDTER